MHFVLLHCHECASPVLSRSAPSLNPLAPFASSRPDLCVSCRLGIVSTRHRHTCGIQYTVHNICSQQRTLAQPFCPVLRSVAHIKPIDKSQSSSFLILFALSSPSASTHTQVRPLLRHTASSHVRMNVLPKRTSTLRLPESLVSPIQPFPAEGLSLSLCVAERGLGTESAHQGARGGGHLLLDLVHQ